LPFDRPKLSKLVLRARSDIATLLDGADSNLSGSPEEVIAIMSAGMTHGLHGHLKWLSKQLLPDLADDEFLLRWASIYSLEQTPATFAEGSVSITGTDTTVCPAGTVWQRGDGVLYDQVDDATISGTTATIDVIAQEAGSDGNALNGVALQLSAPVTGINSAATVSGGITDGVDLETIDALRARLLLRLQNPPKGGGPGDYVNWALEVSGVTRAWEYPAMLGLGTVGVRFVLDDQAVTIIPDAAKVTAVQTYIDSKAPVTADVTVLAPTALALDMTIELDPDTAAIRTAVEEQLEDLLLRQAEPGATILLSQINEAISLAVGEEDHTLTVPAADVTHTANQIAVLGTITWV
jgi:uncharacterized phage protein gp47/JayE